jgi:inosine-uridine nucleoside N-ribohydrolase
MSDLIVVRKVVAQSRKNNAETTHRAGKFIVDQVNKYPGEVVVLSLGAMTNVATALNMDPTLVTKIKVRIRIKCHYYHVIPIMILTKHYKC